MSSASASQPPRGRPATSHPPPSPLAGRHSFDSESHARLAGHPPPAPQGATQVPPTHMPFTQSLAPEHFWPVALSPQSGSLTGQPVAHMPSAAQCCGQSGSLSGSAHATVQKPS